MNNVHLKDQTNNPFDWFNTNGTFEDIFKLKKDYILKEDGTITTTAPEAKPLYLWQDFTIENLVKNNTADPPGVYSKFHYLVKFRFNNKATDALNFIEYELKKNDFPYMRIGVDYFKIVERTTRYGGIEVLLNKWKKEEIKYDHPGQMFLIKRYDGFTIVPDNVNYHQSIKGWYNLYSKFPHTPFTGTVTEEDIPVTMQLIKHIFGEKYNLGIRYLQYLYIYPQQICPVLCLVSTERNTGKTTFLNWMEMIFGENSVLISPEDLTRNFNSSYIDKNIITIDETTVERNTTVEKLKSIATAKRATYSMKNVAEHSIPTFCKVILCTNKEAKFMRIDDEEIRFWVRKINHIVTLNTNIEKDLFKEIPKLLKFLLQQPEPTKHLKASRMGFTPEEIYTDALANTKKTSRSWLYKDLVGFIDNYFLENEKVEEFYATTLQIKAKFWPTFAAEPKTHYLAEVLIDEFKIKASSPQRRQSFNEGDSVLGRYYHFKRDDWCNFKAEAEEEEEKIPF